MTSSARCLCALEAVAGLGMVAASMSKICGDCKPDAVVSNGISGPVGGFCERELETALSQKG